MLPLRVPGYTPAMLDALLRRPARRSGSAPAAAASRSILRDDAPLLAAASAARG